MKLTRRIKRPVAFLLATILCLGSSVFYASSDSLPATPVGDIHIEEEPMANPFNKIHFYFGNEEHAYIDDMAELSEAVGELEEGRSIMSNPDYIGDPPDVTIRVQFVSTITNACISNIQGKSRISFDYK